MLKTIFSRDKSRLSWLLLHKHHQNFIFAEKKGKDEKYEKVRRWESEKSISFQTSR